MTNTAPVALITGAARRIGAHLAQRLHAAGYRVLVHYHRSSAEAAQLVASLNQQRPDSAAALQANLSELAEVKQLAHSALARWQRLDVLINNASSFYPTPIDGATPEHWDDLMNSNLKAPFFLVQALAPALRRHQGCVINMADIHAQRPLKDHPIYCAAKAGNMMLTQALARDLAPDVRVNGIAPGAILWPEQTAALDREAQQRILEKVPMQRQGSPDDIAEAVLFLVQKSPYITGQIIAVDGGRTLCS